MPLMILNLLKRIPLKPLLILLAVLALIGAEVYTYGIAFDAGYADAKVKLQDKSIAAAAEAVAKAREQWNKSTASGQTALEIEKSITRRLQNVERNIQKAVAESSTACTNVGESVLRLFNDTIATANASDGGSTAAP